MLNEKDLRIEARLLAVEELANRAFGSMLMVMEPAVADRLLANWEAGLETVTVPGLDAAQSDAVAAQFRDETLRLLSDVRRMLAASRPPNREPGQ